MGQKFKANSKELIIVGAVGAPFGVRGWLKINSYTDPRSNIWQFKDWWLVAAGSEMQQDHLGCINISRVKESPERFLVLFEGMSDRTKAAQLTNHKILITRNSLPKLSANEYYWADLLGSKVYNLEKIFIGILDYAFHNGANDVMVVKGDKEYFIPYILDEVVTSVEVAAKIIKVKWDLD